MPAVISMPGTISVATHRLIAMTMIAEKQSHQSTKAWLTSVRSWLRMG